MPNSAVALQSELHDYAPYGQVADATALDTAILALSPWGYWKMGANMNDSSPNARHGTYGITPVWNQGALTGKGGPSVLLANGWVGMPLVQAHLSAASGTYTYIGLLNMNALPAPGSPAGNRYLGSIFLHQSTEGANYYDLRVGAQDIGDGGSLTLASGTMPFGGVVSVIQLNKPMVLALVGTSLPGLIWSWNIWMNGVKIVSEYPRSGSAAGGNGYLCIGRLGSTERLAQLYASNWAAWNLQLSDAQIMDLTECYMDKAAYAAAWKPR